MNSPLIWLAVAGGGALGAVMRYGVARLAAAFFGTSFPWGTFLVNVAGSFLMGVVIVWLAAREPMAPLLRSFLTVGVLGAFTTFSTFSLDAVSLFEDKAYLAAGLYVAGSVVFSIIGLALGLSIMRALT